MRCDRRCCRPTHRVPHTPRTWLCSMRWDRVLSMSSRERAAMRVTLSPVASILDARWSTATLLGAATSTCSPGGHRPRCRVRGSGADLNSCAHRGLQPWHRSLGCTHAAWPELVGAGKQPLRGQMAHDRRRGDLDRVQDAGLGLPRGTHLAAPWEARWYTMEADVTVLPVPGGPWMRDSGLCSALRTAVAWDALSSGRDGAEQSLGSVAVTACGCTSCPSSLHSARR